MSEQIQWFPGHMAKTRRIIGECMPNVDLVVEVCDARIPCSSRNPEIDSLAENKKRVILLNKCSLSDPEKNSRWCDFYKSEGMYALCTDCKTGEGISSFIPLARSAMADITEKWNARGMIGRKPRLMIVGIPNVGKSTLINKLAGTTRAKAEDRPGVTRGKQWVSLGNGIDLLDMPGMLWPKFESELTGLMLSFCGSVKDEIIDCEYVAVKLLEILMTDYRKLLDARYNTQEIEVNDAFEFLEQIGKKRGMLMSGGVVNTERAAKMFLDEFRGGILGRITLEDCNINGGV